MDYTLKKVLTGLVVLTAVLFAAGTLLFNTVLREFAFGFFPYLTGILLIVNAGFFTYFYRSLKQSPNQFIRGFMVSTGLKLLFYILLVLAYVFVSPETAVPFAVTLFVMYLAFTIYDSLIMLSLLKKKK
ncbi:MAG: hypothetical protein JXQ80_05235 [Bacteroidales bacterium]|nr:hypothetical protein [Bacteroidales bacterium]